MGGGTHACSPVPTLLPDVQPALGASCLGARGPGALRPPWQPLSPPRGFGSVVSLERVLRAPALRPRPLFLLSRLLPRVSFPAPRPGGETLPPARSRSPGVLRWGPAALGGAFPNSACWGGAFQQPLPARGVQLWAPDGPAGSGWGCRASGGRTPARGVLAAPAAAEPLVPSWVSGEQGKLGAAAW